MSNRLKKYEKVWTGAIYVCVYLLFQLILIMAAMWNECLDSYLGLILFPLMLGIAGIVWMVKKDGNVRLILYAGMLLSIGQLVQSVIQEGEDYISYMNSYQKFMLIALAGGVLLYFLYRKCFAILYNPKMQILLCAAILLCFVVLKSPLGHQENNALLWIKVGTFQFQITELFKPLMVFVVAGFLCRKKKVSVIILLISLGCIALVAGATAVVLNEFGTGLVVGVTGLVMYFIFQNTKMSKGVGIVAAIGVCVVMLCYWKGSSIYSDIPMKVSNKTFAEEFAACCDKRELVEILNKRMAGMSGEELKAKEAQLTESYNSLINAANAEGETGDKTEIVTYNGICYFLTNEISNDLVRGSYPKEEGLTKVQRRLVRYIQILAEDKTFKEDYREAFIERKIYANRMLSAYAKYQEETKAGFLSELEEQFLNIYWPNAEKVQRKFSGFLNPQGESRDNAYQINNAMSAMSTAGIFGNGPEIKKNDASRIFAYDSDMVFAMVVSELGYVMGALVILLNLLIFQEIVFVALETPKMSTYQQGICIGMGCSWIVQAFFIIGGNCRLFPFSGITLPLISNGGSSLVVSLWMLLLVALMSVYPIVPKREHLRKMKEKNLEKALEFELPEDDEEEDDEKMEKSTRLFMGAEEMDKSDKEDEEWLNPFKDIDG